jgi:hypothetical protein
MGAARAADGNASDVTATTVNKNVDSALRPMAQSDRIAMDSIDMPSQLMVASGPPQ